MKRKLRNLSILLLLCLSTIKYSYSQTNFILVWVPFSGDKPIFPVVISENTIDTFLLKRFICLKPKDDIYAVRYQGTLVNFTYVFDSIKYSTILRCLNEILPSGNQDSIIINYANSRIGFSIIENGKLSRKYITYSSEEGCGLFKSFIEALQQNNCNCDKLIQAFTEPIYGLEARLCN